MPIDPRIQEFPRMLFRGQATCVVSDADAKAAKLADGWAVRLLPGETEDDYGPLDAPDTGETAGRRRGRKPAE